MNDELLTEEVIVKALTDPKAIKLVASLIIKELSEKKKAGDSLQIKIIQQSVLFAAESDPTGDFMTAKQIFESVCTAHSVEANDPDLKFAFTLNQFSRGLSKLTLKKKMIKGVANYFVRGISFSFTEEELEKYESESVRALKEKITNTDVVDAKEVTGESPLKKVLEKVKEDPTFATESKEKSIDEEIDEEIENANKKDKKKKKKNKKSDTTDDFEVIKKGNDFEIDKRKKEETPRFQVIEKKVLKKMSNKDLDNYLTLCKELEPDSADDLKKVIKKIKKKRK